MLLSYIRCDDGSGGDYDAEDNKMFEFSFVDDLLRYINRLFHDIR